MMNPNMMARGKSLEALMAAMDEDQSKRLPGLNGVTIEISSGGAPGMEDGASGKEEEPLEAGLGDMDQGGMDSGQPSDFEEFLKRKKQEKMGGY